MKEFCNAVLDFLQAEYGDAFIFSIEQRIIAPKGILYDNVHIELTIKMSTRYRLIITNDNMQCLFHLYRQGKFLKDRKQYLWQKELVDMIEGV